VSFTTVTISSPPPLAFTERSLPAGAEITELASVPLQSVHVPAELLHVQPPWIVAPESDTTSVYVP
jgi:hypothetical protein